MDEGQAGQIWNLFYRTRILALALDKNQFKLFERVICFYIYLPLVRKINTAILQDIRLTRFVHILIQN